MLANSIDPKKSITNLYDISIINMNSAKARFLYNFGDVLIKEATAATTTAGKTALTTIGTDVSLLLGDYYYYTLYNNKTIDGSSTKNWVLTKVKTLHAYLTSYKSGYYATNNTDFKADYSSVLGKTITVENDLNNATSVLASDQNLYSHMSSLNSAVKTWSEHVFYNFYHEKIT